MDYLPNYLAYKKQFRTVYTTGPKHWGHTPDEQELQKNLTEWLERHNLKGKRRIMNYNYMITVKDHQRHLTYAMESLRQSAPMLIS